MTKFSIVLLAICYSVAAIAVPVKIKYTNTGRQPGKVLAAVFKDPGFFPDNSRGIVLKDAVRVTRSQTTAETVLDLPPGDYAIAVFLDENGNEKLDKNLLGIPTERFGFSKNPPVRRGAPRFSQCDFRVEEEGAEISINLKKIL